MPFPGPFNYLIDSLSDSTIYMAYYTVCHYLQGGARYIQGECRRQLQLVRLNKSKFCATTTAEDFFLRHSILQ